MFFRKTPVWGQKACFMARMPIKGQRLWITGKVYETNPSEVVMPSRRIRPVTETKRLCLPRPRKPYNCPFWGFLLFFPRPSLKLSIFFFLEAKDVVASTTSRIGGVNRTAVSLSSANAHLTPPVSFAPRGNCVSDFVSFKRCVTQVSPGTSGA